jgi:hypothetical protein
MRTLTLISFVNIFFTVKSLLIIIIKSYYLSTSNKEHD